MATNLLLMPQWSVAVLSLLLSLSAFGFNGFGAELDRYIKEASLRYQVSETMLRGLIKMEDGWYGKRSTTGATGVGQFTVGTWNWLADTQEGRSIGMVLITPRTRGTKSDPRHNTYVNTLATALLAQYHLEQFKLKNIPPTESNLYLAHNIGLEGLNRALQNKATAEDIKNMRLNGMKKGMSVQDFIRYQKGRYNQHWQQANSLLLVNSSVQVSQVTWITATPPPIRWINPN